MRILLVEDDPLLGDGLERGLVQAGFTVDWVRDGVAAGAALAGVSYDALVLDLGLPRRDGLEVLRRLRGAGDRLPVLVLTARDAVPDRIVGLDAGADDYVLKPCDLDELAARLRALMRRAHGNPAPRIVVGDLELDPAARRVSWRGAAVDLSSREFAVLEALALNAGRVLSRRRLEELLYGWGEEVESNAVEVHVHHLRRKLDAAVIRTVRGVGYTLLRPGEAS